MHTIFKKNYIKKSQLLDEEKIEKMFKYSTISQLNLYVQQSIYSSVIILIAL